METGFNSRYLLDMMAQIEGDVVQFVLADATAPALVRDPADVGAVYVIMPMRV
jgi:DNA polymerase-3 subunit beta